MTLAHPEALLLVPLFALLLRRGLWPRPLVGALRVLLVTLLALAVARPGYGTVDDGRDVVLVVDRSRSMPDDGLERARELAARIAERLPDGDRIGVVAFANGAHVISPPQTELRWPDEVAPIDRDGSDLAAGLQAALALVEDGRQATLLVFSDGEVTGDDALSAARIAARRSIRVDVEPVPRAAGRDAAIGDVRAPAEAPIDAPFAVEATVLTTTATNVTWRLLVDGEPRQSGAAQLRAGRNVLQVQHRLREAGEHLVAFECSMPGDVIAQNDRGLAVVRATDRTRVLCVTPGGREDRLSGSLQALGIDVVVHAPETAPLTLAQLDGFAAVVLENVAAARLPVGGMRALRTWVRDLGGGLLMTGGDQSFGVGGYHLSPVEDVMPVTMEIREEQRAFGLAMAIALDRSGSMAARVGDSSKMQLANRGAAGAIELLSEIDAVAVLAVDTSADVVVERRAVDDAAQLVERVRSIETGGGGIYVEEALRACVAQLDGATQQNKHVVLFADATDAEEPGEYADYLPELVEQGFTVSVIGLGDDTGRDAQLLEDLARLGGGRCQFVADATELPRVFAQETIQVTRSSLVEEPTGVVVEPALQLLGALPADVPALGGYSIGWLRERSERGMVSDDERTAPLLAHWQCGLGRAAAFLGEADGELTGDWRAWSGYGDFFATVVRWLCGGSTAGVFVDARREGDVGVYELEVEAERAALLDRAQGTRTAPDGTTHELVLRPVAPGVVQVRVPLAQAGVHRAAVRIGDETLRLPPLCLPYSAEWSQQLDARAGERALRRLARRTGGAVSPSTQQVLDGPRASLGRRELDVWLLLLALVVFVAEVAVRRLQVQLPALRLRRAAGEATRAARTPKVRPAAKRARDDEADDGGAAAGAGDDDELLGALARAHRRGRKRV